MVCNTKRQASEMKAAAKACLGRRQKGVDGFVYAVTNPAWPGLVKLGSAVDLNKRLTSYQTSCPHRAFRVEASAFVDDRIKEEKALMALFKPNQHLNEWFRLDVAVVVRVLESIRNRRSSHVEAVP